MAKQIPLVLIDGGIKQLPAYDSIIDPTRAEKLYRTRGSVEQGLTVILNDDGTISNVTSTVEATSIGAPTDAGLGTASAAVVLSDGKTLVIAYSADFYVNLVTCTVTSGSMTVGTPVVAGDYRSFAHSLCEVGNTGVVYLGYMSDSGNYGVAAEIGVSGITVGTPIIAIPNYTTIASCVYDPISGVVVIAYIVVVSGVYMGETKTISITGLTCTVGTPSYYTSARSFTCNLVYDKISRKIVYVYTGPTPDFYLFVNTGTVKEGLIVFDGEESLGTRPGSSDGLRIVYTPNGLLLGMTEVTTNYCILYILRVLEDGSRILSAKQTVSTARAYTTVGLGYNSTTGVVLFSHGYGGGANYSSCRTGRFVAGGVVFGSEVDYLAVKTYRENIVFVKEIDQLVMVAGYAGTPFKVKVAKIVATLPGTTYDADGFIGFSDETVGSDQLTTVATLGCVASGLSGLVPKSKYYLDAVGALTLSDVTGVKAGIALSENELLVDPDVIQAASEAEGTFGPFTIGYESGTNSLAITYTGA